MPSFQRDSFCLDMAIERDDHISFCPYLTSSHLKIREEHPQPFTWLLAVCLLPLHQLFPHDSLTLSNRLIRVIRTADTITLTDGDLRVWPHFCVIVQADHSFMQLYRTVLCSVKWPQPV